MIQCLSFEPRGTVEGKIAAEAKVNVFLNTNKNEFKIQNCHSSADTFMIPDVSEPSQRNSEDD